MKQKLVHALALATVLIAHSSLGMAADPKPKDLPQYCPPPGTVVLLTKAMNDSFIKDYKECDIVVEATFFKMGNEGYKLGKYDTKANTTFQVLEPGGAPQAQLGMSFGIFAGTPKSKSNILFELKQGDQILLRGAPILYSLLGTKMAAVFHAESVTRKIE